MYSKTLFASWADMDFNSHMRNTAFLDKSADVRMMFFAENGFPMSEFLRLRLDLSARKLIAPPEALHQAMKSLPQTSDFQVLPSSVK